MEMDNNQRMIVWCASWALVGGAVVCTGCMNGQVIADSSKTFPHQPNCKNDGEVSRHPWGELHDILDAERG
jgi:hypothetical protein